jgi:hypothetical protein
MPTTRTMATTTRTRGRTRRRPPSSGAVTFAGSRLLLLLAASSTEAFVRPTADAPAGYAAGGAFPNCRPHNEATVRRRGRGQPPDDRAFRHYSKATAAEGSLPATRGQQWAARRDAGGDHDDGVDHDRRRQEEEEPRSATCHPNHQQSRRRFPKLYVVECAMAAFWRSWRRQMRQLVAGLVLAGCLFFGCVPLGSCAPSTITAAAAAAADIAANLGTTAVSTVVPSPSSSSTSKGMLLLARSAPSSLTQRFARASTRDYDNGNGNDEQERGLVQLKRNLLREGIDPYMDWEGQRQVHFHSTGIDLAGGGVGGGLAAPWPAAASSSNSETPRQFVERQWERAQGHYAPHSAPAQKLLRNQRHVLRCVVQDLEARGIDPLEYLERNPRHLQSIHQLSHREAERLAVLYNRNLHRHGRIMTAKIRIGNALERHVLAPILSTPTSAAPPPFRDYLLPSISASTTKSRSPDWFDDSDAKAASHEQDEGTASKTPEQAQDDKQSSKPFWKQRTRSKGRTSLPSRELTRSGDGAGPATLAGAKAASASSSSSSLVGMLRKAYAVPVVGLLLIGAAAMSLSSRSHTGDSDGDGERAARADIGGTTGSQSGQDLDFQRLYTLLTGDTGSYKSRLPQDDADRDVPVPLPFAPAPSPKAETTPPSPAVDSKDAAGDAASPSVTSLFARWMPHKRYGGGTGASAGNDSDKALRGGETDRTDTTSSPAAASSLSAAASTLAAAAALSSTAAAASISSAASSSSAAAVSTASDSASRMSEALAMSRSMSLEELATMEIPTSFRPGAIESDQGSSSTTNRPRDLFAFLSTIPDEKTNEFARQLAKLLALGAPAEFFWHVHSLSGGTLPVDVTSSSVDSIQRFLLGAREAAGINSTDARQLFDDAKRCMMTDLMELESRLLQGPTTTDAIHHVVDFMAHVSTVNDALVESFALPLLSVAPGPHASNAPVPQHHEMAVPSEQDAASLYPLVTRADVSDCPELAPTLERLAPTDASSEGTTSALDSPTSTGVSHEVSSNHRDALDSSTSTNSDPGSAPLEKEQPSPSLPATASVDDVDVLRPSYDESYASLRSFLEKLQDTYSGTGGLY